MSQAPKSAGCGEPQVVFGSSTVLGKEHPHPHPGAASGRGHRLSGRVHAGHYQQTAGALLGKMVFICPRCAAGKRRIVRGRKKVIQAIKNTAAPSLYTSAVVEPLLGDELRPHSVMGWHLMG